MATEAVLQTLRQLFVILNQTNILAAVVGGLALAAWKHPRTTLDVDVLLVADKKQLTALAEGLRQSGFHLKRDRSISLGEADLLQFTYEPQGAFVDVQVDLLVAKSMYAREALTRCVSLPAEALGFEVQVIACEDLIVLKLLAGRIIDRADAAALLRANYAVMDHNLLSALAERLDLTEALAEIQREARQ